MNLYLLSQSENRGYDTYDSCVVCAGNETLARETRPGYSNWGDLFNSWASKPANVTVEFLGQAGDRISAGVICESFNAG